MFRIQSSTVLLGPLHEFTDKAIDFSAEGIVGSKSTKKVAATRTRDARKRSPKIRRKS